jgi:hypothetical protein
METRGTHTHTCTHGPPHHTCNRSRSQDTGCCCCCCCCCSFRAGPTLQQHTTPDSRHQGIPGVVWLDPTTTPAGTLTTHSAVPSQTPQPVADVTGDFLLLLLLLLLTSLHPQPCTEVYLWCFGVCTAGDVPACDAGGTLCPNPSPPPAGQGSKGPTSLPSGADTMAEDAVWCRLCCAVLCCAVCPVLLHPAALPACWCCT